MSERYTIEQFDLLDNGYPMDMTECRDRLNEQAYLIEKLRLDNEKIKEKNKAYHKGQLELANYNLTLIKENEELREELNKLRE